MTPFALADAAVRPDQELRHDEQGDAARALRRAFDARQDEVDDVLGEVVLAGRDEDLGAGDGVGAVAVRRGLGLDQAEIGAAMRLRQVHGAGPAALDHRRQVGGLLLLRAVHEERRHGAHGQPRIHGEGHVGRRRELVHDDVEGIRQALAAVFGRHGEPHPAALGEGLVRALEAWRRRDAPVVVATAALEIAGPVHGSQHLLAEFRALRQHGLDEIGRGVGEARQVVVTLHPEDVVQQEQHVLDGCLVDRHASPIHAACPERSTGRPPPGRCEADIDQPPS